MDRIQKEAIVSDLKKKMVLLAGPRQAGKTTLAKAIAEHFSSYIYLNYDRAADRRIIKDESWLSSIELLIFDEIHKMPGWKNYLKGVFDTKQDKQKILVTGSARLEVFRSAGDSLAGRYFLHRLMPFSAAELSQLEQSVDLDRLMERGGFPEPYLEISSTEAKRWRSQYAESLISIDVLDFENIQNVNAIRLVFELLRERVGSPLSYTSIAEDVSISVNTVKKYLSILEALYIVFSIRPFSKKIARSLSKEPKFYFFDTGIVKGDQGAKFENLVAMSLYKHLLARNDHFAENYSLHYLRTKDQREVDFAIAKDNVMEKMIEVKYAKHQLSDGIRYFHEKYGYPACQLVKDLKREEKKMGVEILDAARFLKDLYL